MPFKISDSFIEENQVIAVLSGGTEAQFVDLVREKKIDLKRPVYLMVSEFSNSLPAALEILSFIRQRNGLAKIMMHENEYRWKKCCITIRSCVWALSALLRIG